MLTCSTSASFLLTSASFFFRSTLCLTYPWRTAATHSSTARGLPCILVRLPRSAAGGESLQRGQDQERK